MSEERKHDGQRDDAPFFLAPEEEAHETTQGEEPSWEQLVLFQGRNRCSNCGGTGRLRVRMIVPEEAGGKKVVTNGVVLCRACDLASEVVVRAQESVETPQRPTSFWVSRALFERVKAYNGFTSTTALVRYLIQKFVEDESRFDDLAQYQDEGTDVKINIWVDVPIYDDFKNRINDRGMTVTDALKSLLCMYGSEAEPLVKRRDDHVD